jgi:hypothetical protein
LSSGRGESEARVQENSREALSNVNQNPDNLEVAPGTVHEGIEGWVPELASEDDIRVALEKAFDYRGDVMVTTRDGTKIEGYVFDRTAGDTLATSFVRILPKDSSPRAKVCYADISALAFTGRDTAAGKSFEAWIRKYWEKKSAGEGHLNLQPESLDEP